MKTPRLLLLATSLLLASCASSRHGPQESEAQASSFNEAAQALAHRKAALAHPPLAADSVPPPRVGGFLGFVKGLVAPRPKQPVTINVAPGAPLPHFGKLKNSQVSVQIGTGNQASQASLGKNKGTAQMATDSSTLNAVTGGGNLAAVAGDGNTLEQKAELPPPAPGLGAIIAGKLSGPLGVILALAVAGLGCYYIIPLLPKRRKNKEENAA